jgi:hypothetical protein
MDAKAEARQARYLAARAKKGLVRVSLAVPSHLVEAYKAQAESDREQWARGPSCPISDGAVILTP